jgi:hypothetical protein
MWQDRPNLPDAATPEALDHPRNFDRVKDEERLVLDPLHLRVLSHYNDSRIPVWIAEVTAALCSISPGGWTQERVKSWLHRNGAQYSRTCHRGEEPAPTGFRRDPGSKLKSFTPHLFKIGYFHPHFRQLAPKFSEPRWESTRAAGGTPLCETNRLSASLPFLSCGFAL